MEDGQDCIRELQEEEDHNCRDPEGVLMVVGDTLGSQAESQGDSCKEQEEHLEEHLEERQEERQVEHQVEHQVVPGGRMVDRVNQVLVPGLRTLHRSCFNFESFQ